MADLVASISATAKAVPEMEVKAVSKAGSHTAKMMRAEIKKVTGGNQRLSNLRNVKIDVGYAKPTTANPRVEIRGRGPWRITETGTRPHRIPKKRKRGKRRYAVVGGHPYDHADHPGTRGTHPIEKGWRKAEPEITNIMQDAVRDLFKKAWL